MRNNNRKNNNKKNNNNKKREVSNETAYILNSMLFNSDTWKCFLVIIGLYLLNPDFKTLSTNYSMILGIVPILFLLFGYNLIYGIPAGGYIGTLTQWSDGSSIDTGYSDSSDWLFQMVFAMIAVTISMGNVLDYTKDNFVRAFVILISVLSYSITTGWQWGGGWLAELGFSDFSGSSLVFVVGAVISTIFSILIGSKVGVFEENGNVSKEIAEKLVNADNNFISNILITLGMVGFNKGSQLAQGTEADTNAVNYITVNTILAAGGSILVGFLLKVFYPNLNSFSVLGGLAAIAAEPLAPSHGMSIIIGILGSIVYFLGSKLAIGLKIYQPINAIGILFAGILGTLLVPFTNGDVSFGSQLLGAGSITAFTGVFSVVLLTILKVVYGLRGPN